MKSKMLKITAIVMMMAGSFYSCGKRGENNFSEPKEIPVTKYFLYETGCWWINTEPDKVIVINSDKELEKHIACSDDVEYPAVDFSKQTLLLVSGVTSCCGVWDIDPFFFQNGEKKYTLEVTIRLTVTAFAEPWSIAVFTSKMSNEVNIKLKVEEKY